MPRPCLAVLAAALACAVAPTALAGEKPGGVTGASFSFSAGASGPRGTAGASGSGVVAPEAKRRVLIRIAFAPRSGRGLRVTAALTGWRLDYVLPRKVLVLPIEVATSTRGAACPTGTRGTVTLVDAPAGLATGRSSDSVRVRFAHGACRSLARSWSNAGRGARARVVIALRGAG